MLRPLLALALCASFLPAADGWPNIARKLPPVGKEIPEADAKRLRAAVDELTAALAKQLHRPAIAPVPLFALRILLGEFADYAVASQRVLPGALRAAGFEYRHPTVGDALAAALREY